MPRTHVTANVTLRKMIGIHVEDNEFNRRAAEYAANAVKLARADRARKRKTTHQLNVERLSHHN